MSVEIIALEARVTLLEEIVRRSTSSSLWSTGLIWPLNERPRKVDNEQSPKADKEDQRGSQESQEGSAN